MKRFLPVVAFAVLAGCLQTPDAVTSTSAAPAMGTALIAPEQAAALFAKACIEKRPGFSGIEQALANEPLQRSASTGTLFHQRYNLSFNTSKDRCSMVFGTKLSDDAVISGLARGTSAAVSLASMPSNLEITSKTGPDGLSYFRMVLPG